MNLTNIGNILMDDLRGLFGLPVYTYDVYKTVMPSGATGKITRAHKYIQEKISSPFQHWRDYSLYDEYYVTPNITDEVEQFLKCNDCSVWMKHFITPRHNTTHQNYWLQTVTKEQLQNTLQTIREAFHHNKDNTTLTEELVNNKIVINNAEECNKARKECTKLILKW